MRVLAAILDGREPDRLSGATTRYAPQQQVHSKISREEYRRTSKTGHPLKLTEEGTSHFRPIPRDKMIGMTVTILNTGP
jgi:hypothetical protein